MRLLDNDPRWVEADGRVGVGISFSCPCTCGLRAGVGFANPLDGGPAVPVSVDLEGKPTHWQRTGDTFETLTLSPSIVLWREGAIHWHGILVQGDLR